MANTTFGSIGGAGGLATTPVSSYTYKDVGINVIVTPRVTFDGDVVLELSVENSAVGQDVNIAGQNFPSFASRKVETKIRLRDGESTLLAGLLREDSRRVYKGFPGLIHLPVFKSLFTSNDLSSSQTDIVMLLTPRIVRGHDLKQQDIDPVYIGSQQNLGLSGPPPLIGGPEPGAAPAPPAPQGAPGQPRPRRRNRHAAAARRRPADAAGSVDHAATAAAATARSLKPRSRRCCSLSRRPRPLRPRPRRLRRLAACE